MIQPHYPSGCMLIEDELSDKHGMVPPDESEEVRNCIPHISTCLNTNSSHDLVHNCTRGPYDLVTTPEKGRDFRNQYCAQCNGVNSTQCLPLPSLPIVTEVLLTGECIMLSAEYSIRTLRATVRHARACTAPWRVPAQFLPSIYHISQPNKHHHYIAPCVHLHDVSFKFLN